MALIISVLLLSCSGPMQERTTLNFWQFWADTNTKPVIMQLVSEFERENPDIKVKVTDLTWANGHDKLVLSFAAHQPPDIMELGSDWIAEFASNDLLTNFDSLQFPQNYLYPASWKGRIYAVPWLLDSRLLYFNLDLLKRVGVGIPRTWAELLDACKKIDSLGDDSFGFGANSAERHRLYKKFLPFLWSNGGQVLNSDGTMSQLDSPQSIEALQYYLDLCNCGLIESQRRIEEYFRQGKIGFVVSGGWLLNRLVMTPPSFKYQLSEFFTPDGRPGTSFFGGEYLAVYANSEKLEAAKKLAIFLARKENSQRLCDAAGFGFPPYDSLNITDPNAQIEVNQLLNSRANPPTPLWVDIEQDIEDAIEAAMYGHGTVADILKKASQTIDAKLKSGANATAN
jgi:multiple sugar transport system substrate-binding protein